MEQIYKITKIEFIYENEKEREEHINEMLKQGFIVDDKKYYDVNKSLYNPDYKLYACFMK